MALENALPAQPIGDARWMSLFRQLGQYQATHGHCLVPLHCRQNPKLGAWLAEQREHFRKGRLPSERRLALEGLGVDWDDGKSLPDRAYTDRRWEGRFAELIAFQKQHGHLNVTEKTEASPGLCSWRDQQRIKLRKGTLDPDRKARLDAIGFEWQAPGRLASSKEEHNEATWERWFEGLLHYQEEHGHTQVPGSGKNLGKWVSRQRQAKSEGKLPPDREARLDEIGFAWESDNLHIQRGWEERYAQLVAFMHQHGHTGVTKHNENSPGLHSWRDQQRLKLRNGTLTPKRKALLDAIGFKWVASGRMSVAMAVQREAEWDSMFAQLLIYKDEHGDCHVPTTWKENRLLAKWVVRQRGHNNKGTLRPDRKARLDEIGFAWKSELLHIQQGWERRFSQLAAFQQQHGHTRVTVTNQPDPALRHWVDHQLLLYRRHTIDPERKARLDAIGFEWEPPPRWLRGAALWDHHFAKLVEFHRQHGHTDVPARWPDDPALADWVRRQRLAHEFGSLSFAQVTRLEGIGFSWITEEAAHWEARFAELVAFHKKHGHCHPSSKRPRTRSLAEWLRRQRKMLRDDKLPAERQARLDAIDWQEPAPAPPRKPKSPKPPKPPKPDIRPIWEDRFDELAAFVHTHGHTRVPDQPGALKRLRNWAIKQRTSQRRGRLRPELKARLDSLGFDWDPGGWRHITTGPARSIWEVRLQQLTAFRERHGHTNVPKQSADKDLAGWVYRQRFLHRHGQLSDERIRRLEDLGFIWNPRSETPAWQHHLEELRQFRQEHGHATVPVDYPLNPKLGWWVTSTRQQRKKGKLTAAQIQQLDALGFVWEASRAKSPTASPARFI